MAVALLELETTVCVVALEEILRSSGRPLRNRFTASDTHGSA